MPIGTGAAILASGALSAGSSIFGSMQANKSADRQYAATMAAMEEANRRYREYQNLLSPYMNMGGAASKDLQERMPFLTSPIVMDQDALEKTPGYQFTRDQGLRAAQNALTGVGLGRTGSAVKAATRFAAGLADQTQQTQFGQENVNRTNAWNRLYQAAGLGKDAVTALGGAGINTGQAVGNYLVQGGNAQAAGMMGQANYLQQGAQGIGGNLLLAAMLAGNNKQAAAPAAGMYDPATNAPNYPNPHGGSWWLS